MPFSKGYSRVMGDRDCAVSDAMVGIFWCIGESVFGEAVLLGKAEPYGDALQHGGHYDFWQDFKPETVEECKLKAHAYDYYPRGRVVYFQSRGLFRLYVDNCLSAEKLQIVVDFFHLGRVPLEIESDKHYQCARCNSRLLKLK